MRTNIALFVITNFAEPSKKSDLVWKACAALDNLSALGALGAGSNPVASIDFSVFSIISLEIK